MIDERTVEMRTAMWEQTINEPNRITLVAEDESGAVIGFASALVIDPEQERYDSYLQLLYLVADAKRRGTGRALLRALAPMLIAKGCTNMALRVLRENPARGFYERLGARLAPEGISIDAGEFDDVVYSFDDLTALLR